jgi:signal transduction histidine kinase
MDLPHLFDRFYRGENARGQQEGSGLGLAIARQVADRHGISIKVNSAPGEGTEFVFHIGSIMI